MNRNVDYVIEFQTDANFGATIMQKMDDAKIKVTGDRHSHGQRDILRGQ